MGKSLDAFYRFLDEPIFPWARIALALLTIFVGLSFTAPMWHIDMSAPQYPQGLELYIYSYKIDGGNDGNDVQEINVLNHYIGMKELKAEEFTELKWIPLVLGAITVLTFRSVVVGTLGSVLDLLVISSYFGLFSLWSFWYKLSAYGHDLDPRAAVQVDPFTPPVFGHKMVGQFEVWSYPSPGAWLVVGFGVFLIAGFIVSWRQTFPKKARSSSKRSVEEES